MLESKSKILKNKLFLYMTEFFAGMWVMAAPLMIENKKPDNMDVLIIRMGTANYAIQTKLS